MTEKEINIKLAQFQGYWPTLSWRFSYNKDTPKILMRANNREEAEKLRREQIELWSSRGFDASNFSEVEEYENWSEPDYCQSLELVNEIEEELNFPKEYIDILQNLCDSEGRHVAFATAKQRAESLALYLDQPRSSAGSR